jgi:hypothetical protein
MIQPVEALNHTISQEALSDLLSEAQKAGGRKLEVDCLQLLTSNSQEESGASIVQNGKLNFAVLYLPEYYRSELAKTEIPAHEIGHLLFHYAVEAIQDRRVRQSLLEGLCDAVALAVLEQQIGRERVVTHVGQRALRYETFLAQNPELTSGENCLVSPPLYEYASGAEAMSHIVGRNFAYWLLSRGVHTRTFIECTLSMPPTEHDLHNPRGYFPVVQSFTTPFHEVQPHPIPINLARRLI